MRASDGASSDRASSSARAPARGCHAVGSAAYAPSGWHRGPSGRALGDARARRSCALARAPLGARVPSQPRAPIHPCAEAQRSPRASGHGDPERTRAEAGCGRALRARGASCRSPLARAASSANGFVSFQDVAPWVAPLASARASSATECVRWVWSYCVLSSSWPCVLPQFRDRRSDVHVLATAFSLGLMSPPKRLANTWVNSAPRNRMAAE